MQTIGTRIRHARQRALMTQEDLASASGVAVVTLSRLENDQYTEPRPATVRKLAQALDVDPAWLMFGDEGLGKVAA